MFAKERQSKICEMVKINEAVTTSYLMQCFDVSIETIRKDLLYLENKGLLVRVHGGAVATGKTKPFANLNSRNFENSQQKKELSERAVDFIGEGDIIAIDAGSTAIVFAETLKDRFKSLTVLTFSLDVLKILSDSGYNVLFCGGRYLPSENATVGGFTLDMIDKVHIQKAFIFPTAVSMQFGISDYQDDITQIQRKLLNASDEVFILADSSKFEKKALIKIGDMLPKYSYVTDTSISEELLDIYGQNDLRIYY